MHSSSAVHLHLAQTYWKSILKKEDWAIDATCGNGQDTQFLSSLCNVIGIDIQKVAIENTEKLLQELGRKAFLYLHPHQKIDLLPCPQPPQLIVYNLGYLPRSDKTIVTQVETTLESLEKARSLLKEGGGISIMCYPGHPEGKKEQKTILEWAQLLPSSDWLICHHEWINRRSGPSFLWMRKIGTTSQMCFHKPKNFPKEHQGENPHGNQNLPSQSTPFL